MEQDTKELIDRLTATNEQLVKQNKRQLILTAVIAAVCVLSVIAMLILIPNIKSSSEKLNALSARISSLLPEDGETLIKELETSVKNIETITSQLTKQYNDDMISDLNESVENILTVTTELAEADLNGMVKNINDLASATQIQLGNAMEKLDQIDLDTLNRAIKNLADVIQPLADFFNIFN